MRMLIPILLLLPVIPTPVMAQQKMLKDDVGIVSECVVIPVGRILLISRDNFMGAVKFFHNEERFDGAYSKFEYFEHEKGGFKKVREGEVSIKKPSTGFWAKLMGFLSFHKSPFKLAGPPLNLGNFSLVAVAGDGEHSTVYFWSKPNKPDLKVRMAPTPWKEISEIDLSDPRIQWFRYSDKESRKIVPIDKIWD